MKLFLLTLACLISINKTYSQTVIEIKKENDPNKIFNKVEVEATYPGGDTTWNQFLAKNLNTAIPVDNGAPKGKFIVIVKFIVSKDGSLTDVYCENDPGYGMCQESVRIIKKSLKWVPAQVEGRNVNAYRRQPIAFQVE